MPRLTTLTLLAALCCASLAACSSTTPDHAVAQAAETTGVANLAQPYPSLFTSGQLDREQMTALAQAGVATFISLRQASEGGAGWEEEFAAGLGVRFVRLPIAGADDISWQKAGELDGVLAAAGDAPQVLYCGSSNRVGALLALRAASVLGDSPEAAMALGESAGLSSLRPVVAQRLLE